MTYNEVINIAKRLSKEIQQTIDKEVDERLEILKEGELSEEELDKMSECLYISLVLQEYLNGEYELLEDEKNLLLEEMEEMYNEYGELLGKAKIEEKLSKKKRMTLELMQIREQLFGYRAQYKNCDTKMKENRENNDTFKQLTSKEKMREVAKENKRNHKENNILGFGSSNINPKKEIRDQQARNEIEQLRGKVNEMQNNQSSTSRKENVASNATNTGRDPIVNTIEGVTSATESINVGPSIRNNPGFSRFKDGQ